MQHLYWQKRPPRGVCIACWRDQVSIASTFHVQITLSDHRIPSQLECIMLWKNLKSFSCASVMLELPFAFLFIYLYIIHMYTLQVIGSLITLLQFLVCQSMPILKILCSCLYLWSSLALSLFVHSISISSSSIHTVYVFPLSTLIVESSSFLLLAPF